MESTGDCFSLAGVTYSRAALIGTLNRNDWATYYGFDGSGHRDPSVR